MKGKKLTIVILCLLGFFVSAVGAPGPILAVIGKDLNITSASNLSLIVTLPMLFMVPTMLLSGALAARISKKVLVSIGGAIYLSSAFWPVFTDNWILILVSRAILGLGCGIIFPLPFAMISDYFQGQSRHTVMGIVTAGWCFWGVSVAIVSGVVGNVAWRNAFVLYVFGIVPFLFLFLLPRVEKAVPAQGDASEKKSGAPAPMVYVYGVALFLIFAGVQIAGPVISSFIVGERLGTGSAAGSSIAAKTFGTFLTGLFFGPLFGLLKKWSAFVAVAVSAGGYLMLSVSPSVPMVILSMLIIGFSLGIVGPVFMTKATKASPNAISLSLAITQVGMMVGAFGSSLLLQLFGMLGGGTPRMTFLYSSVMLGAMAAAFLVAAMRSSEEKVAPLQEQEVLAR